MSSRPLHTTRAGTLYYGNLATLNTTAAAFSVPGNDGAGHVEVGQVAAGLAAAFSAPGNNGAGLSPDHHIPTVHPSMT